jgi:acyl-coenzyme A thioesterase PaaI-like protein
VIAAVLDETIGRAIMARGTLRIWGVTKEVRVRYRQPVPLGIELTAVGRITAEDERIFEGVGELRLADGTVAAEAHAKYRKLDVDQIDDFDPQREKWAARAS